MRISLVNFLQVLLIAGAPLLVSAYAAVEKAPVPAVVETPETPPVESDGKGPAATMVPGTAAYVNGEWTYTDYVYDDTGTGSFEYPAETATIKEGNDYNDNAADGVLFSVTSNESDSVRLTLRLNTLIREDTTVFSVAVDTDLSNDTGGGEWPFNSMLSSSGWDFVVTSWGAGAVVTTSDGTEIPVSTSTDLVTNTVTVDIPSKVADPARNVWRMRAAVGLWDSSNEQWLTPDGKSDDRAPNAFNLLFRNRIWDGGTALTDENDSADAFQAGQQHAALASGDIAPFFRDVDFGLLQDRADIRPSYPRTEQELTRIYESVVGNNNYPEGRILTTSPQTLTPVGVDHRIYNGLFQPYVLFVPAEYWELDQSAPLIPMGHGLWGNHRAYKANDDAYWAVIRELGILVAKMLVRGEQTWVQGLGELDIVEVIADVRRNYNVDDDRLFMSGTSMGGMASLKMGGLHPQLFAGIIPSVPPNHRSFPWPTKPPGVYSWDFVEITPSLRNVPALIFYGTRDQLVPLGLEPERWCDRMMAMQYDVECWRHHNGGHDNFNAPRALEIREMLTTRTRVNNPAHVVYANQGAFRYHAEVAGIDEVLSYDQVYWVSNIQYTAPGDYRDPDVYALDPTGQTYVTDRDLDPDGAPRRIIEGEDTSIIDIRSWGSGEGEPLRTAVEDTEEFETVRRGWHLSPGEIVPAQNEFEMQLTLIEGLDLDLARMSLTTDDLTASVQGDRTVTLGLIFDDQKSKKNKKHHNHKKHKKQGCYATLDGTPLEVTASGGRLELVIKLSETAQTLEVDCQP